MTQIYSDPKRESDPNALPDVEVWQAYVKLVGCGRCGGESEVPANVEPMCYSCGDDARVNRIEGTPRVAWWWWMCFPGCLPDGEPNGPFDTEQLAIRDAQSQADDGVDDDDGAEMLTADFDHGFSISMTREQAESASHAGRCDDDVADLVTVPEIAAQLDAIGPEKIRHELRESGGWDDDELADDTQNRLRIVWIAASRIVEMGDDDPDDLPPCVRYMRCYCAGHARGNPASMACDTSEAPTESANVSGRNGG